MLSTAKYLYSSPIGLLQLEEYNSALTECLWVSAAKQIQQRPSSLIKLAILQLDEYFAGTRKHFTVPLILAGTTFQKTVWQALSTIPYGKTLCYRDIATLIGNPQAARAVGSANRANKLCLFIPCHRVICASGKEGGYNGNPEKKHRLLQLEKEPHQNKSILSQ